QGSRIIMDKFNSILSSELTKLLPNMVKAHCKEYCDDKVPSLARSTAETVAVSTINSMVPPMVSSGVHNEIQQQFPLYLQNHNGVQNLLANHINQLNTTLNNSAAEQHVKIARQDEKDRKSTRLNSSH